MSEANQSQSWLVSNKIKKQSVCKKCVSEVNQSQSWLASHKIKKQSVCEKVCEWSQSKSELIGGKYDLKIKCVRKKCVSEANQSQSW